MSSKIVQTRFGGPEVLELVEQPSPAPDALTADEVLVRVAFAGVNPIDVMTRTGGAMAAAGLITLPFTPGWDLAGTVEAVGSQVRSLAVGDRVFGMARFPHAGAAYAQYAVVPAVDLALTPDTLTDAAAAALPLAAMTAWQAFADTTHVTNGQRVLIAGAGGGVGHFAVQIAHHLGATVTAVAGAGKHDWLRGLGADRTVDYTDPAALAALADQPVDVALNLVGGDTGRHALAAVRPGGILISLVGAGDDLRGAADLTGVRLATTSVRTERAWLAQITHLAATKALVPEVARVFDLADAAQAHRLVEAGHVQGKVVLRA
ncbi:NADPH:quinone reductase [Actinoplanes sp. ATCC 53533]|uniref:NADP-dependent oxidoreductase n=1 Tax=Actinoplanes sp. ATCC 53533 TaxID=1288362 RepID=UPI000F79B00A|nr:NADP-dependent oxidoreductase [Actinoplanes sp. ATCC 53533]RSM63945.1 NADPH:quinone reductase [Actinoplanes sp. ATCC 53533]